nr:MGC147405 protein [Xenopus tropicalis]
MHWAVQSKKEPMLEAPNADPFKMPDKVSSTCDDKKNQSDLMDKSQEDDEVLSPKSPEESVDTPYNLLRFRWSAEAPSDLLRKFRNYDI